MAFIRLPDSLNAVSAVVGYNAPVILSFVFLSFCVWAVNTFTVGAANTLFFSTYRSSLLSPLTYFRMVGHVLGHANFGHYINNMMIILLVGPVLEEKYGGLLLTIMIFCTAIVTSVVHCTTSRNTALCGASGVAFMLMLLASVVEVQAGKVPLTLVLVAILYIGREMWTWLTVDDDVSRLTHIVGGACGAIFGLALASFAGI